jgi:CBS domain-containing protein
MKIREMMSKNPTCCTADETVQNVAKMMCESNVGSIPVVADRQSRTLLGMVTDRDLCCSVLVQGLDAKATAIRDFVTYSPVSCREGENIDKCERLMQEHQIRRIPIVDGDNHVIGIVAQADLALKEKGAEKVHKTVAEISKSKPSSIVAA